MISDKLYSKEYNRDRLAFASQSLYFTVISAHFYLLVVLNVLISKCDFSPLSLVLNTVYSKVLSLLIILQIIDEV